MLSRLETRQASVHATLLRISGVIKLIEEELEKAARGPRPLARLSARAQRSLRSQLIFRQRQEFRPLIGMPIGTMETQPQVSIEVAKSHTVTAIVAIERLRILQPGAEQLPRGGARHTDGVTAFTETGPQDQQFPARQTMQPGAVGHISLPALRIDLPDPGR